MTLDSHRKYDVMMCYECGYMEGRNLGDNIQKSSITNYERLCKMSFNETVAFLCSRLGLNETKVSAWLEDNAS